MSEQTRTLLLRLARRGKAFVEVDGVALEGNMAVFDSGGRSIKDGGKPVIGAAASGDGEIVLFDGTTGKVFKSSGKTMDGLRREYLTLQKTAVQTTNSAAETVTWETETAIGGNSLLARDGSKLKCLADCYLKITAVVYAYTIDPGTAVKFQLFRNGVLNREVVTNRSATTWSSVSTGIIVTEPISCCAGDWFEIGINSPDTSITITSSASTMFSAEAWKRS